eukprot:c21063_g2_i2.p1 GENE.c21063_g2_i2~~c21063_g2_i2.p1  ORF type:complete len:1228 (+),score=606.75 c21063_g2_i2:74-3685(+)
MLVRELETVFQAPNVPPEILQQLLDLAEFMEHCDTPFPIDTRVLSSLAENCHAYAKALHYREIEFHISPASTLESLVSINSQLGQRESALGILTFAGRYHTATINESWFEKLQQWEKALQVYEKKVIETPNDHNLLFSRLTCYNALGYWEKQHQLCIDFWPRMDTHLQNNLAPFLAHSCLHLMDWESLPRAVDAMGLNTYEKYFYSAINFILTNKFDLALQNINKCRHIVDTDLTALVGESYSRAYNKLVNVQQLAELEEVIIFKQSVDDVSRQNEIRKMWRDRLDGCQRDVEVWLQILSVRWLVINPQSDISTNIRFASMCSRDQRKTLAERALRGVCKDTTLPITFDDISSEVAEFLFKNQGLIPIQKKTPSTPFTDPRVCYALLKYLWNSDHQKEALAGIYKLSQNLSSSLPNGIYDEDPKVSEILKEKGEQQNEQATLLSKVYVKYVDWMLQQKGYSSETMQESFKLLKLSTKLNPQSYKAWHAWANINLHAVTSAGIAGHKSKLASRWLKSTQSGRSSNQESSDSFEGWSSLVPAVTGFIKSISLGGQKSLQDLLRLLTLWFTHGSKTEVDDALDKEFNAISIDTWLQVVPQLIARIDTPTTAIRERVHELLSRVAQQHPQALIYSLAVACKSQSTNRRQAAERILNRMRQHSGELVEQALIVSEELIRVAILWHEQWHSGLEDASRLYFGEQNIPEMFEILEPLHKTLEKGAETMREVSFQQAFGRDLAEAWEWCQRYQKANDVSHLNQAWEIYSRVFKQISKQLQTITTIELQYCSQKLKDATNLELAVPGTYRSGVPVVKIKSFNPSMNIMSSKQRPRKFGCKGSDGVDYTFLLKGHEDLRQDERVMQLFGLVNSLFNNHPATSRTDLSIQRYAVIPLSPNSGLIEWVPRCDTLHALISDYRQSRKIQINIEHRLWGHFTTNFEKLTAMEKLEVFDYILESTSGQELYRVLWLKSRNSEVWLDRRTNFTRSLAVMSMVGYILGLGDRHPSNIMLHRSSGKILHIDFGDCFEVAMHRDKFPERIPFRLTRMLVNAMEVCGIEGNFRCTCEKVMTVLRDGKDSAMAMLEAFVHDPLINWRLLSTVSPHHNGSAKPVPLQNSDLIHIPAFDPSAPLTPTPSRFTDSRGLDGEDFSGGDAKEMLNRKALEVTNRVEAKLRGTDFGGPVLKVENQVDKLIEQATNHENLSQLYLGWCPFW